MIHAPKKIKPDRKLTALEQAAYNWLVEADEPDYGPPQRFRDLQHGGCSSGTVGDLAYYWDTGCFIPPRRRQTVKFYDRHKTEISALLAEALSDCDSTPAMMFERAGWDADDPLALETFNRNILAWFGFEEAARTVANLQGWGE